MKEYLLQVVGITLICSILTAVIPRGRNINIICGVAKMICILVIVAPLLNLLKNRNQNNFDEVYQKIFSDSVIETDGDFIKYYSESTVAYIEQELEREILEKYAFTVFVTLDWEYEEALFQELYSDFKVKIIQIRVDTNEDLNEEEKNVVWKFLTNNYYSEVLIE